MDPFTDETVVEIVLSYVNANSFEEQKQVVEKNHDILLTDKADEVLVELIQQYRDNETAISNLRLFRSRLIRSRNEGYQTVFKDPSFPFDENLLRIVEELIKTPANKTLIEFVKRHQNELFSDETFKVFDFVLIFYRDSPEILQIVRSYRATVAQCKKQGIDNAFTQQGYNIPEDVSEASRKFFEAKTWDEAREILSEKKELLLSDDAIFYLDTAVELARRYNDGAMRVKIGVHRTVLTEYRSGKIEHPFPDAKFDEEFKEYAAKKTRELTVEEEVACQEETMAFFREMYDRGQFSLEMVFSLVEERPELLNAVKKILTDKENPIIVFSTSLLEKDEKIDILKTISELNDMPDGLQRIKHGENVLKCWEKNEGPYEWALIHKALSQEYWELPGGDPGENIERGIEHAKLALEVFRYESYPKDWADCHQNLGILYNIRYKQERSGNIEQALYHYEQAGKIYSREKYPEDWGSLHLNIVDAYIKRICGDPAQNIEEAITHCHLALEIFDRKNHPVVWAKIQMNLGMVYQHRRKDDIRANVYNAAKHTGLGQEIFKKDEYPYEYALSALSLAQTYLKNMDIFDDPNFFAETKHMLEDTVEVLYKLKNRDKLTSAYNLLAALHSKKDNPLTEDIEQAIKYYLLSADYYDRYEYSFEWAMIRYNLASCYLRRCKGKPDENFRLWTQCLNSALEVFTRENCPEMWAKIHFAFATHYANPTFFKKEKDLKKAIEHFRLTLEGQKGDQFLSGRLNTLRNLGELYFNEKQWQKASEVYNEALDIRQLLLQEYSTPRSRTRLIYTTSEIAPNLAYALTMQEKCKDAVVVLENSLAVFLGEALARNDAALQHASQEDRDTFFSLRQTIENLEANVHSETFNQDFAIFSKELAEARQQLRKIIKKIREYVPAFIPLGLQFPDLVHLTVKIKQPIVYLVSTSSGSLAFIVLPGSVTAESMIVVRLDNFNENDLSGILYHKNRDERYTSLTMRQEIAPRERIEKLEGLLAKLFPVLEKKLMAPIAENLEQAGFRNAVLIPEGRLTLLPLHAICIGRVNFSSAHSSYTLKSLCESLKKKKTSDDTYLGIADPKSDLPSLPFAELEVGEASGFFREDARKILSGEDVTIDNLKQNLPGVTHLHFSCHALFDHRDPLSSYIQLSGDGSLTLNALLFDNTLDLSDLQMVVLSACQTGIDVPNAATGFPSGFMYADVPCVLGTLWPVHSVSCALLLMKFYRLHLLENLSPVEALYEAQMWLKSATIERLKLVEHTRHLFEKSGEEDKKVESMYRLYSEMSTMIPFSNPYRWAAFYISGIHPISL